MQLQQGFSSSSGTLHTQHLKYLSSIYITYANTPINSFITHTHTHTNPLCQLINSLALIPVDFVVCSLRGTGGDLIILEEAAFIANDVWTEVVIPLIEVKNTALIAISTPLDSSNFYSTLVSMTDDRGEKVFEVLEARAACAECIEKLDDPSKCPHVQLERPAWKSKEKQQIVKALYQGNSQVMLERAWA